MMSLYILGLGFELPSTELDNKFLYERVGMECGLDWVNSRLGIERRYSVLSREYLVKTKNRNPAEAVVLARERGQTPVTLAVGAAKKALEHADVRADQVGLVIASNDTPFEGIPATASFVARELGIGSGPHCDLNCACSSFVRHMKLLADSKEASLPEFILCVQTGACTTRIDYSSRSVDGYILGDGAAAQVLSTRREGRLRVEPMIFDTKPSGAGEIIIESFGHLIQNGSAVREFSIRKTCEMFKEIAGRKDLCIEKVYTVAHQANYVMQNSIIGHLSLPPERHLRNVKEQGNIAAAGCPSVIVQNIDRLLKGDKIIYAILGAGLAWGGGYMEVL